MRYLAFPRSGPETKALRTMAAVWCADDRREALTRATHGQEVKVQEGRACSDAVIAKHYALGQQLGIPGTPIIVLGDGTSHGGCMSVEQTARRDREARGRSGQQKIQLNSDSRPVRDRGREPLLSPAFSAAAVPVASRLTF